jgi:hypothetical protein
MQVQITFDLDDSILARGGLLGMPVGEHLKAALIRGLAELVDARQTPDTPLEVEETLLRALQGRGDEESP